MKAADVQGAARHFIVRYDAAGFTAAVLTRPGKAGCRAPTLYVRIRYGNHVGDVHAPDFETSGDLYQGLTAMADALVSESTRPAVHA